MPRFPAAPWCEVGGGRHADAPLDRARRPDVRRRQRHHRIRVDVRAVAGRPARRTRRNGRLGGRGYRDVLNRHHLCRNLGDAAGSGRHRPRPAVQPRQCRRSHDGVDGLGRLQHGGADRGRGDAALPRSAIRMALHRSRLRHTVVGWHRAVRWPARPVHHHQCRRRQVLHLRELDGDVAEDRHPDRDRRDADRLALRDFELHGGWLVRAVRTAGRTGGDLEWRRDLLLHRLPPRGGHGRRGAQSGLHSADGADAVDPHLLRRLWRHPARLHRGPGARRGRGRMVASRPVGRYRPGRRGRLGAGHPLAGQPSQCRGGDRAVRRCSRGRRLERPHRLCAGGGRSVSAHRRDAVPAGGAARRHDPQPGRLDPRLRRPAVRRSCPAQQLRHRAVLRRRGRSPSSPCAR